MSELLAQRAAEDEAATIDGFLAGGGTPAATHGGLSAGAASCATSLSSGRGEAAAALAVEGLPAVLREWLIHTEDIHILDRPGRPGERWMLGEGARCAARARHREWDAAPQLAACPYRPACRLAA